MDVPAAQHVHARSGDGPDRRHDRRAARPPDRHARGRRRAAGLIAALALLPGAPLAAETLRIATFHTDLTRAGPGLLLRDLRDDEDPQITATLEVIASADADILVLQGVDYDAGGLALAALADRLAARDAAYPHRLALRPNTGRPTGVDIDGDGRSWRARDAHGYGHFNGQGGMAILSRHPVAAVRDFSGHLWSDLPGSAAAGVLPAEALPVLRLASVAAWDVALRLPDGGDLHLLTLHATPPVFDGPEDRNGHRNADELRFWQLYLDGWAPAPPAFAAERFVLAGTLNVDPLRGEGRRAALLSLLSHPRLQDPRPRRPGGGRETADWPEPDPGDLRVDYILPSASLRVTGSGILWPEAGDAEAVPPADTVALASDHRLVWVDLHLGDR